MDDLFSLSTMTLATQGPEGPHAARIHDVEQVGVEEGLAARERDEPRAHVARFAEDLP